MKTRILLAAALALSGAGVAFAQGEYGPGEEMGAAEMRGATAELSPEAVSRIQTALNRRGFDAGPEDGVLGPQTVDALMEFKRSRGLRATERIDASTLRALGVRARERMRGAEMYEGRGGPEMQYGPEEEEEGY